MRKILMIQMTNIQTRKHQPTQMMVRVLEAAVIIINKPIWAKTDPTGCARFPPKSLQNDYSSTIFLESVQDLHHTSLSSFHILFNEPVLRNTQKCITAEEHCVTGNNSWTVTLDKLDKPMKLIVARGPIGGRNLPIKSMRDKFWGCPFFNATMPRWIFLEIMRYLRCNLKTERRRNLEENKF